MEDYVYTAIHPKRKLPTKWLAPECMLDSLFTAAVSEVLRNEQTCSLCSCRATCGRLACCCGKSSVSSPSIDVKLKHHKSGDDGRCAVSRCECAHDVPRAHGRTLPHAKGQSHQCVTSCHECRACCDVTYIVSSIYCRAILNVYSFDFLHKYVHT